MNSNRAWMTGVCSHGIPFYGASNECVDCSIGWVKHSIEWHTASLDRAKQNLEALEAKKKAQTPCGCKSAECECKQGYLCRMVQEIREGKSKQSEFPPSSERYVIGKDKKMNATRMVGQDEPLMIAWNAYKATEEYANSRQWAGYKEHLDGSLWAVFCAGYAAMDAEIAGKARLPIAWMTAGKDRIRWLSRSLEKALATPMPSQQDAIKAVDDMESLLATDPKFATYFDRISIARDFILARPDEVTK